MAGNIGKAKADAMYSSNSVWDAKPGIPCGNSTVDSAHTPRTTDDDTDSDSSLIGPAEAESSLPHPTDDVISLPNREWGNDMINKIPHVVGRWQSHTDDGDEGKAVSLGVLNGNWRAGKGTTMEDYITKCLQDSPAQVITLQEASTALLDKLNNTPEPTPETTGNEGVMLTTANELSLIHI